MIILPKYKVNPVKVKPENEPFRRTAGRARVNIAIQIVVFAIKEILPALIFGVTGVPAACPGAVARQGQYACCFHISHCPDYIPIRVKNRRCQENSHCTALQPVSARENGHCTALQSVPA
jgi:hypothetical protein